jgi:peptide/nickel transport system substrate-binding protein
MAKLLGMATRCGYPKILHVALALTSVSSTACQTSTGRAHSSHELRVADWGDPSSLNPLLAHDQDTIGFDLLVVQTLVGLDAANRIVSVLVTRVPSRANGDISPDGKTIVYHLRRGVRFADGKPLTSRDVAFTFHAIMDGRNPVLSQDAYRRIASLLTPDSQTVIVHLRAPWNAAVRELFAQSDFAFGILPAHAFGSTALQGAPWEEHAFGSGPFRVTSWRRGDRVILEPNPYFSPRPKLTRIELRMLPDANTAMVALRSDEVDLTRISPVHVAELTSAPNLRVVSTQINGMDYLSLQTRAPPTNELPVRRAIADALDVALIERSFHGLYPRAAAFLPPVFAWHDASLTPRNQDVAEAAAQLDAVGWRLHGGVRQRNGTPLDVLVVVQSNGESGFESIVQRQLAEVGIGATIKSFPASTFNGPEGPIRTGLYNVAIRGWIGGADPEQSVTFSCSQIGPDGDNISRFCDRTFDAAFEDQKSVRTKWRRARDFLSMQRIVYDRIPIVPLNYVVYFDAVNARVSGFARNMLGFPVGAENWDVKQR